MLRGWGIRTEQLAPIVLVIELRRGLETLPLKTEVDLTQHGSEALTFRLRRWIDMQELGYQNGDTHVHFLSQSQAHLQMRAEDLNILNLLVSDFTNDREKFTGKTRPGIDSGSHSIRGPGISRLAKRARHFAGHQSHRGAVRTVWRHISESKRTQSRDGQNSQRGAGSGRRHHLGPFLQSTRGGVSYRHRSRTGRCGRSDYV